MSEQWIPVSERLPEVAKGCRYVSKYVLVYAKQGYGEPFMTAAIYDHKIKQWRETDGVMEFSGVTHWMLLPDPPPVV